MNDTQGFLSALRLLHLHQMSKKVGQHLLRIKAAAAAGCCSLLSCTPLYNVVFCNRRQTIASCVVVQQKISAKRCERGKDNTTAFNSTCTTQSLYKVCFFLSKSRLFTDVVYALN